MGAALWLKRSTGDERGGAARGCGGLSWEKGRNKSHFGKILVDDDNDEEGGRKGGMNGGKKGGVQMRWSG